MIDNVYIKLESSGTSFEGGGTKLVYERRPAPDDPNTVDTRRLQCETGSAWVAVGQALKLTDMSKVYEVVESIWGQCRDKADLVLRASRLLAEGGQPDPFTTIEDLGHGVAHYPVGCYATLLHARVVSGNWQSRTYRLDLNAHRFDIDFEATGATLGVGFHPTHHPAYTQV